MLKIREAVKTDLKQLVELYTQLHNNTMPKFDDRLEKLWADILDDKNHHVLVGVVGNKIVSSLVIIIVPNLTHEQRPYALCENVITHFEHRNRGYAMKLLDFAKAIAEKENCYKIMLMTGSKNKKVLSFYENAGYNREDKTAFIKWLNR